MDIFMILKLIGGLAFFLFGMRVMSESLEKMAGGKLEHLIKKMTKNPVMSMLLGAVITIAMQSSSATTVMLVGLVNSGIMQFSQTLNVIFGANVGTTLTSWILSLSGIQSENIILQMMKPENFSPIVALIGIIMLMFCNGDKKKSIGTVFVGFAVLMYGMELMKEAATPLSELPEFKEILVEFNNPIIGVTVGTLFTAVIQSSAASIGILQALSLTGGISYGMAIPIVMGQNIGTCATSLLSCIGTNTNAKRVAVVHVSIKIIGTIVCLSIFTLLNRVFNWAFVDAHVSPVTIAMIHTAFNIVITIILMPFVKLLVKMTEWLVKDKKSVDDEFENEIYLDERLFRTPSVAIKECNSLLKRMSKLSRKNFMLSVGLIEEYDESIAKSILEDEKKLDTYQDRLGEYLTKLSMQAISSHDSKVISKVLHVVGDCERIGDHAVNLEKICKEMRETKVHFSDEAMHELTVIQNAIDEILNKTIVALSKNDLEMAQSVEPLEQVIDHLTRAVKNNHVNRVREKKCSATEEFSFLDILSNFERVSDHCSNIAVAIIEAESDNLSTHQYLHEAKHESETFKELYNRYKGEYTL